MKFTNLAPVFARVDETLAKLHSRVSRVPLQSFKDCCKLFQCACSSPFCEDDINTGSRQHSAIAMRMRWSDSTSVLNTVTVSSMSPSLSTCDKSGLSTYNRIKYFTLYNQL